MTALPPPYPLAWPDGQRRTAARDKSAFRTKLEGAIKRATHMAFKHRELWEAKNGPVPAGHALKCLDGDKTNCDPKNWEAVPLGLLSRLHGKSGRDYDRAPDELKPIIMATAQLEHAVAKVRKGQARG